MSKQTAVEWLVEQMIKYELVPKGIHFNNVLFHQAKAMEREQMKVTYNQGLMSNFQNFEQYYNETYKGDEQ